MINLKTNDQIAKIRESCHLLARMFQEIEPLIKEGNNILDLEKWAVSFISQHGGKPAFKGYEGFPAALCISINEQVIHGIPRDRVIKAGDLVSIDSGIELKGYFSDMAYTFPVGTITGAEQKLLTATKQSLEAAVAALHVGGRVRDVARAVTEVIRPYHFGIVHQYCGHGVGISQHEDPQISNALTVGPNPRLVPGMVLAIEPMINLGKPEVRVLSDDWTVVTMDGKKSAHFEYTVAILEDSVEILTTL